jgi:hypothetical protein
LRLNFVQQVVPAGQELDRALQLAQAGFYLIQIGSNFGSNKFIGKSCVYCVSRHQLEVDANRQECQAAKAASA